MTDILLYDPSAPAENETQIRRTALDGLRGRTVGVIDNSKKNFDQLAEAMATVLKRDYGAADVLIRRKRMPSLPAPDEVIAEMTEQCDLVITGSGD